MDRRRFLHLAAECLAGTAAGCALPGRRWDTGSGRPPDILLITADDMNRDTPGCYGGCAPDITPNIDRLASEGMLFEQAHVSVSVCMPSRQVLMTGRYPHRYGSEGFNPIARNVPTLQERLHAAGYLNGILGKVSHLLPERKYHWDFRQDFYELNCGRDPRRYYTFAKEFFDRANRARRPFFLMANSHDPHRPFALSEEEKEASKQQWKGQQIDPRGVPDPSRVYRPEEVSTPGFLPDLPRIRTDAANYHNSVRRCDDTVGAVLRALRESGRESNTLVMFLSDNGMDFPFAKANCYLHSTRTPWIVRGRGASGRVPPMAFISFRASIICQRFSRPPGCPRSMEWTGDPFFPSCGGRTRKAATGCSRSSTKRFTNSYFPCGAFRTPVGGISITPGPMR
jgi:N-sulfoglucosamine sulfohydrolase